MPQEDTADAEVYLSVPFLALAGLKRPALYLNAEVLFWEERCLRDLHLAEGRAKVVQEHQEHGDGANVKEKQGKHR